MATAIICAATPSTGTGLRAVQTSLTRALTSSLPSNLLNILISGSFFPYYMPILTGHILRRSYLPDLNPVIGRLTGIAAYVNGQHFFPVGPVVAIAVPDAESVPDALFPEELAQPLVIAEERVVFADGNDQFQIADFFQVIVIVFAGDVFAGTALGDIVIHVAAGPFADIIDTAHTDDAVEMFGEAQSNTDRMIGTKAGTGGDAKVIGIFGLGEGYYFLDDVILILQMPMSFVAVLDVAVEPAFGVDAVDAVDLDPAVFEMFSYRLVHLSVFPVKEATLGGGKHNYAGSRMAPDDQLHVAVEVGAVPFMILSLHLIIAFGCRN